jgi:hypothetical protein
MCLRHFFFYEFVSTVESRMLLRATITATAVFKCISRTCGLLNFLFRTTGTQWCARSFFSPSSEHRILLVANNNNTNSIIIATYSATVGDLDRDKEPFSCVYGSSSNSDLPSTKSESICSVIVTRSWKILISEAFFFVTR